MVNKAFENSASEYANERQKQREERENNSVKGGLFTLILSDAVPQRCRIMHPTSAALKLVLHMWVDGKYVPTICNKQMYGQECDQCDKKKIVQDKNGNEKEIDNRPDIFLGMVVWNYDIGSAGKKQVSARGNEYVVSAEQVALVPAGPAEVNWNTLILHSEKGILFDAPYQFQRFKGKQGGYQTPMQVNKVTIDGLDWDIPQSTLDKYNAPSDDGSGGFDKYKDMVHTNILSSLKNVHWTEIGLEKPSEEQKEPVSSPAGKSSKALLNKPSNS